MRGAVGVVCLCLAVFGATASAQTTTAAATPSKAPGFNYSIVVGNLTARQDACRQYQLPQPFNNVTYDTAFLGPYRSIVVGADNYTYHRFGPLQGPGSNVTLVLVPDQRTSSNIWTPDLLQLLSISREVITFDLPGAGSPSTTSSDQQTLDSISQSLVGFFRALGLTKPDILGYGWGGTIGLNLGAFYGDSVGNLVLVSTTSGGDGYIEGDFLASNVSAPANALDALLFPNSIDGQNGLCKLNAFQGIMPGPNLTASEVRNQSVVVNEAWANNTLSESISNIINPTLLVAGELDVITDFQSTLFLLENINQSVLLSTNGAGNGLLFQDTENAAPVILEFLDYYDDYDYEHVYEYTG